MPATQAIAIDVALPPVPLDPPGDIVLPPTPFDPPGDIVLDPIPIPTPIASPIPATLTCTPVSPRGTVGQTLTLRASGGFGSSFGYHWDLGEQQGDCLALTFDVLTVRWRTPGTKRIVLSDTAQTVECSILIE